MPVKYKRYLIFLIISLLLFGLRIYLLWETPLYDYDSVKNYVVAGEIASGDLTNLFQRRIPTVHLFNALLYSVASEPFFLVSFHALISTLALGLFVFWISERSGLDLKDSSLLYLFSGTSLILVNMSRYMSIESWTLLFFLLFIRYYLEWIEDRDPKRLWYSLILYAIATTVNYKFLFLFPLIAGIEIWISSSFYDWRKLGMVFLILSAPFLLYSLVGWISGAGGLKYIIVHATTLLSFQHNPIQSGGSFDYDLGVYPRFIWFFQNPLVIPAFLWILWSYSRSWRDLKQNPNFLGYLLLFTLNYLVLAFLIRKAPRGLIFVDVFLSYFLFMLIFQLFRKKWLATLIVILSIGFNLLKIQQEIYPYSQTAYPEMAAFIEEQGIQKLAITTGMGIVPYLPEGTEWEVLFNDRDLDELKSEGYTHALLDDYRIITGMKDFKLLEGLDPELQLEEKSLHSPILALEHAEFVRIGYSEAMDLNKEIRSRPFNLVLVRLD